MVADAADSTPVLVGFQCDLLDRQGVGLGDDGDPGFESARAAADAWFDAFERASGANAEEFIEVVTALGLTFSYHDAESGELVIRLSAAETEDDSFIISESAVCSPPP